MSERRQGGMRLAETLLGRIPELTDRLVALILEEQEAIRELPPEPLADLRAICEANLRSVLTDLAGHQEATVDAPRDTARRRAERGVSLASVLHGYRLGMRVVWDALNEESPIRKPDDLEVLLELVPHLWALFDKYQLAVATAYDETLVDLARRSERERMLFLDDLLAGRDPGGELRASMAAALDLPERGPYLAVSAEIPASGGEGLPKADQALRLHGIRSAWRLRVDEQVGIVALSRDHSPDRVRALLAPLALTRTGISPSYDRLGGTAGAVGLARVTGARDGRRRRRRRSSPRCVGDRRARHRRPGGAFCPRWPARPRPGRTVPPAGDGRGVGGVGRFGDGGREAPLLPPQHASATAWRASRNSPAAPCPIPAHWPRCAPQSKPCASCPPMFSFPDTVARRPE